MNGMQETVPFQQRVRAWMLECFGGDVPGDITERGDRLLEEVLELLQAHGYDRARIPALVDYTYGRPAGEPRQEVGGVMVTLAAYCGATGIDMQAAGDVELARVWTRIEQIREKQATKADIHSESSAMPTEGGPLAIDESFVVRMLDFQPLTRRNLGNRLWQFLEAGGIADGEQIQALLGAIVHATVGARR